MGLLASTARSRELGEALRAHRERKELKSYELAKALGWQASKVSRIESGQQRPSEIDVAMVLAYCHAETEEFEQLRQLSRENDNGHWLQPHRMRAPDELVTLVRHETTAGLIRVWEPLAVPGLLQTEDYARALFQDSGAPQAFIDSRVRIRMERQAIVKREVPPQMYFFIHEQVLHSAPASNPAVLSEQLLHLTLVSGRSECNVLVVPRSRCAQAAFGGTFWLLEFANHGPVAYMQNLTASVFVEDRNDLVEYRDVLKRLADMALDKGESRELMANLASFYG